MALYDTNINSTQPLLRSKPRYKTLDMKWLCLSTANYSFDNNAELTCFNIQALLCKLVIITFIVIVGLPVLPMNWYLCLKMESDSSYKTGYFIISSCLLVFKAESTQVLMGRVIFCINELRTMKIHSQNITVSQAGKQLKSWS